MKAEMNGRPLSLSIDLGVNTTSWTSRNAPRHFRIQPQSAPTQWDRDIVVGRRRSDQSLCWSPGLDFTKPREMIFNWQGKPAFSSETV